MVKVVLILILFLCIGFALFANGYIIGCHSKEVYETNDISNPTFSPDGTHIGFVLLRTHYRKPVGVCTFPNGGTRKLVNTTTEIYTIERNNSSLLKISELPTPYPYKLSSHTTETVFWQDDKIYFSLLEEENGKTNVHNYVTDVKEKTTSNVEYKTSPEKNRNKVRLNSVNPTEWITYDPELGIISYIGGEYVKFSHDEKLGTIYHLELEEKKLQKIWISQEAIQQL